MSNSEKSLVLACCITYIKFGQQLFLQTKGIPMGGNASPLIADLYLSLLEYQYLSKLVRNKDFNLLHKLKYNSRYIDDIITPNVENFLEIAKHLSNRNSFRTN